MSNGIGPEDRWYDEDPALNRALESLRGAPDRYQAQIAINIIKVVIEHQMEHQTGVSADQIQELLSHRQGDDLALRRRWYDVNETLRAAIHLLQDCPDDLQSSVVPTVSRMIEETLVKTLSA